MKSRLIAPVLVFTLLMVLDGLNYSFSLYSQANLSGHQNNPLKTLPKVELIAQACIFLYTLQVCKMGIIKM